MLLKFKTHKKAFILTVVFLFFTIWWLAIQFPIPHREFFNQYYGVFYGTVALIGAFYGIGIQKQWGGVKSLMGKAILMFSLGLFFQEFGQLTYFYYFFVKHIEVPYPSIGDIGYFGSIPLYIYGTVLLAKASGVKVSLQSFRSKIQAVIIPLLILGYSYFVFLQGYTFDWTKPLTIFLDFGYPLGQAIYVSVAILTVLLTRSLLGGMMKYRVLFILFALLIQYVADYTFLYQVSTDVWTAGGINDYIYLVAYFAMSLALLQLRMSMIKSKLS